MSVDLRRQKLPPFPIGDNMTSIFDFLENIVNLFLRAIVGCFNFVVNKLAPASQAYKQSRDYKNRVLSWKKKLDKSKKLNDEL